jgi:hypothetical protein
MPCQSTKRSIGHVRSELTEYNKRKSEREAKERHVARAHRAPYDMIQEALEELKAISHHNEEQEQLREVLRTRPSRRMAEELVPSSPLG